MPDYKTTRTTQSIVTQEVTAPTIKMQIFVRTLIGRTILIQTEHPINVEALKSRIYDTEGIPEYLQRLTRKGKLLTNDQVLWSPNSSHYPTIHMNFNLDGGTLRVKRNPTGTRNSPAAPQQTLSSPTRIPRLPHSVPAAPKLLPNTTTNWTFPLDTNGYANEHNTRHCCYRQLFPLANENLDEGWGWNPRANKPNGCPLKFIPSKTTQAPQPSASPSYFIPPTRTQIQITPTQIPSPSHFIPTNTTNTLTPSLGRRVAPPHQLNLTSVQRPTEPTEPDLLWIWSKVEEYPTICIRARAGWTALTLRHAISRRCGITRHNRQFR